MGFLGKNSVPHHLNLYSFFVKVIKYFRDTGSFRVLGLNKTLK